jgi:hypothetical protein
MNRTGVAGIIASFIALLFIAALLCVAVPAQSQQRVAGQEKGKPHRVQQSPGVPHLKREFAPRVIGRANSFIINGRVLAWRGQRLSLETARGERWDFQVDEQTTLLESSELVSIATMGDIALRPADLRFADEVEVIAERVGNRRLARIVTRTASAQPVAQR